MQTRWNWTWIAASLGVVAAVALAFVSMTTPADSSTSWPTGHEVAIVSSEPVETSAAYSAASVGTFPAVHRYPTRDRVNVDAMYLGMYLALSETSLSYGHFDTDETAELVRQAQEDLLDQNTPSHHKEQIGYILLGYHGFKGMMKTPSHSYGSYPEHSYRPQKRSTGKYRRAPGPRRGFGKGGRNPSLQST